MVKIKKAIIYVAIVMVGLSSYAINQVSQSENDRLISANIEALSNDEKGDVCKWGTATTHEGDVVICYKGGAGDECTCGDYNS